MMNAACAADRIPHPDTHWKTSHVKIPEPLFVVVNPAVRTLLRSPFHWLASKSLMLITFRGRNTGKVFTTPVRFVRDGTEIRAFTSRENQWWRNLDNQRVSLTVEGNTEDYNASVETEDLQMIEQLLVSYLTDFPADAVYHDIRVSNGQLDPNDVARALPEVVIATFQREAA